MDATQYTHVLYTDRHVCKWYIHELKPTLYMCHYMPFQASYLSRFFGSYLRGLGWWHCAKVFPPVLWSLELSNASHGDKTYPSDTGMEIGLCSGSKSVSLSWYHVVSNILTCNAIELGTTLYDICSQYLVLLYRFTSFNHISIWEYNPNSLHALHIH